MITVTVTGPQQNLHLQHESGALEFGRGAQRQLPRVLLEDPYASRDHLRVEELPDGRVRLENLSGSKAIVLNDGPTLPTGATQILRLPLRLTVGRTTVALSRDLAAAEVECASLLTVCAPAHASFTTQDTSTLEALGESPAPEVVAQWLERVIHLQRCGAGAPDFHTQAARSLVELVGLDVGLVLQRKDDGWQTLAGHATDDRANLHYSRTVLERVVTERRTFYQDPGVLADQTMSLRGLDAVVASPVFGLQDEVAGALYGARLFRGRELVAIRPLQAQLVQLLAAAVGSNAARTTALRTRVQFEQFFSSALVRELERDPALLEGRTQEVTILVSDLRGFTRMSERLGAQITCQLVRDMMERMSERIVEQAGVIVDYAGDGILSMWNAPVPQGDHAHRACRAALTMQGEMAGLNARWTSVVGNALVLGVGLNTGPALVGNTGSSRKFKYGPHGHTVNLASRVQDATKRVGVPVLISEATRQKVAGAFVTRNVGPVDMAGVSGSVVLHELQGSGPGSGA
ncbi:MAG: adenylate/guanylate cyclase domain-containing protein [Gemmataceae bacterium]|nr:adenylate/guanylate cyclase domain-containing protein [Gemmataceae bacterium]